MVQGVDTFADLHCDSAADHTHVDTYVFVGVISGGTALLGLWATFKMMSANCIADDDEKMDPRPFVLQLIFFLLCIVCSCMRIPVLYTLCEDPGHSSAMVLYVTYTSVYMLQWSLMLAVLFSRLQGIFEQTQLTGKKSYTALTTCSLTVALVAWIANCVRLLTENSELDDMNWFLGTLSIGSLLACCKILSYAFIRVLYLFHIRFCCAELVAQPLGSSVELIALVTKLTIVTTLSSLSSVLMCVCVVIVGLLSQDMDDNLMFALFCGHSIDVAGNCLAMYLAVNMGASHYKMLCGSVQSCFRDMCIALARRAHQRNLRQDAARQLAAALELTADEIAIATSIAAADAAPANQRLSQRISQNLNHLTMTSVSVSSPDASGTVPGAPEAATSTLPTMIATIANPATCATDDSAGLAVCSVIERIMIEADPEAEPGRDFPFCVISTTLSFPIYSFPI